MRVDELSEERKRRPGSPPDHYFAAKPGARSNESEFVLELRGVSLRLLTDHGVFSKGKLDRGTQLLAKEMWVPPKGRLLDLGCGYGPLGLLAAKLEPEIQVVMVDVNERAVDLASRNAERNGVRNAVAIAGDVREAVSGEFDAIVCNPPIKAGKAAIMALIEYAAAHLTPDGLLWLVMQTHHGAKTLQRDIAPWFAKVECAAIQGGYRVLVATARDERPT
jgi:16S rRNA (guanine1207-N2)-methyltransferase